MAAKLPVFILAGGKSSRFGSDKARALVHDLPLIRVIADRLRKCASQITVIADRAGKYDDLGLKTIADEIPDLGPMGGLKTALDVLDAAKKKDAWFLLCSCDLVGLNANWIEQLGANRKAGERAVAFKGEQWEPLIALYHVSIRAEVERALRGRNASMWKLLEQVKAVEVPLPEDWPRRAQVNSPQELAEFLQHAKGSTTQRKEDVMAASKKPNAASKLPGTFKDFITKFPALGRAHEQVAKAVEAAGPLDAKTCALIKIGICVGAGLESATRSHVRRAMEHGASETEIEQAILLAMNTVGFPKTVAAWAWARQQFERGI